MPHPDPQFAAAGFGALDWAVVIAYLAFTTWLGAKLAGRPASVRDFFLGGRRLPWYAVAGSSIATEISAVTFVSVPFFVFRPGGDFTYLQFGLIGSVLARVIIARVLVPAYFAREIYSPYDFMGERLGGGVRAMTTTLFALGGVLAQSARVYLTAIVLELVLAAPLQALELRTGIPSLTWSIAIIGLVAVVWTWMGGIATVIWTDLILLLVFLIGGIVALCVIAARLDGGLLEIFVVGHDAGKLRVVDLDLDPRKEFTIWTAAIATTWSHVGAFGTDQLMAQRLFCCENQRAAQKAVLAGSLSVVITALMLCVGLGLYAFHQQHPLTGAALAQYQDKGDRIFPLFILHEIPPGLTGLIIAAIFAAAISSLDSILAALSQTTMSALVLPWRRRALARRGADVDAGTETPEEQRTQVRLCRALVVCFGVLLCLTAQMTAAIADRYGSVLQLALALATYVSGALLAGFLLALLRTGRDGFGFLFSAPLSVAFVFAIAWARERADWVWIGAAGAGLAILTAFVLATRTRRVERRGTKVAALALAVGALVLTARAAFFTTVTGVGADARTAHAALAWPWYPLIGALIAFAFGWLLANRSAPQAHAEESP